MILEVRHGSLRDIAAAVHAARKREPKITELRALERKVLAAIRDRQETLELEDQEAQALRNALLMRAHDQRRTAAASDYLDLAERIGSALDVEAPPLEEAPRPQDFGG